ncbi:MAG: hypothetical protein EPO09_15555 [Aquabacterium sp.]|uniref:hypothetical protein n=1 Tax=Aquabacterium sp. TaxID=1872578 RepID=UPI00121B56D7|nr:hypothetical protein [Aquabacterium sp.]TAK91923.1 MAG: hypothetical protein EPO09_15555 [Aquabacterium sp.]
MKHFFRSVSEIAMLAVAMAASSAMAAQSSAYAVSAELSTDGGSPVHMAPQLETSGITTLGQTYSKPLHSAMISKSLRLVPSLSRSPVLTVLELQGTTLAVGSNGVDTINTSGTSSAGSGTIALILPLRSVIDPPRPLPVPASSASSVDDAKSVSAQPLPPLNVTALRVQFNKLKAAAQYSQVIPGPSQRSGSASFGSLVLSGTLVGTKPLTFSGEIKPNTVVVDTPSVKVTLNAQTIPQNPVCDPGKPCPLFRVLETVETKAVLVELTNASVLGHQVSGNIVIGDAEAGQ